MINFKDINETNYSNKNKYHTKKVKKMINQTYNLMMNRINQKYKKNDPPLEFKCEKNNIFNDHLSTFYTYKEIRNNESNIEKNVKILS